MSDWFVHGRALEKPTRTGGINAEKGFLFQRAYATWLLSGLLTSANGVVAIRYEGAQDVDIMKSDGAQIYVQVKRYESTELDWGHTRKIIQRFAEDLHTAQSGGGNDAIDKLSFRLVVAATISDADVLQLMRGVNRHVYAPRMARELLSYGSVDPELSVRVSTVLDRLSAEILPAGIPATVYRLMAEARLSRFGVLPDNIDDAMRTMLDSVKWRATVAGADVLDWISPYLPKTHPGSKAGSIRPFSTRIAGSAVIGDLFYVNQSDIWTGIAQGLDVPREAAAEVYRALSAQAIKLLLHGPSGAGKSTLARRVLWDSHQRGELVALELAGTDCSEEEWEEVCRFAKRLRVEDGVPTVLLIDDLHESELLMQRIKELDGDSGLRVVATTWSKKPTSLDLGPGVLTIELKEISPDEAAALAKRVDRDLNTISKRDLSDLLKSGQFIVLNIALLEGATPVKFGLRLLRKVQSEAAHLVERYLDLCASSASDRAVPFRLLSRLDETAASSLVTSNAMAGLIHYVGNERIRAGHRILSEAILSAADASRIPRLLRLAEAADPNDEAERRFAIGVLEDCIGSDGFSPLWGGRIEPVARSLAMAGHYLDILRCARLLLQADLSSVAAEVEALATFDRVKTGPDAAAYRARLEKNNPQTAFDNLLKFYYYNSTTWGWRNFLHMAKNLDLVRRHQALDMARKRMGRSGVEEGEAKVIIDLLNESRPLPDGSVSFVTWILRLVPGSVVLARATAQLIITGSLRSPELFQRLLEYSLSLTEGSGEPLWLARNLVACARYADDQQKKLVFLKLRELLDVCHSKWPRAILLHGCATLAEQSDIDALSQLVGPSMDGEPAKLNAARQILRKKKARTEG